MLSDLSAKMKYLLTSSALLAATTTVSASFSSNLAYHSPSRRHPSLGIDIPLLKNRHAKRGLEARAWDPEELSFTHGVASGDPYPESVILWTRISPQVENDKSDVTVTGNVPLYNHEVDKYVKTSKNPICVEWRIGKGEKELEEVVSKGEAWTSSDVDFTVKVSFPFK